MKKYILAVLVDNKPGVLTHVSGLISRRAFNIESISAGYTEERDVTRINIEVSVEDDRELEQVVHQLGKLIDVIKIVNLGQSWIFGSRLQRGALWSRHLILRICRYCSI